MSGPDELRSRRPAYRVGTRLRVRWPLESASGANPLLAWFACTVDSIVGPVAPRRPRSPESWFRYMLRWEDGDGSAKTTSRLLHMKHEELPHEALSKLAFQTDESDNAETPLRAYEHIEPVLRAIEESLLTDGARRPRSPKALRIYDPYFCRGQVVDHFAQLGWLSVYNRPEDFYGTPWCRAMLEKVEEEEGAPGPKRRKTSGHLAEPIASCEFFDALVTNPPYSADHVARLFRFAKRCGRPFFLLVPNRFLAGKDYVQIFGGDTGLVFLAPKRRYVYKTPPDMRAAFGATIAGKRSRNQRLKYVAPFVSVWVVGNLPEKVLSRLRDGKIAWAADEAALALGDVGLLPKAARPREETPEALLRKRFNDFCRDASLGKLCFEHCRVVLQGARSTCSGCATKGFEHPEASRWLREALAGFDFSGEALG